MRSLGTFAITFGVNVQRILIEISTDAPETSHSGSYLSVHLPQDTDNDKSAVVVPGQSAPTQIETIYDLPPGTVLLDLLLTSGATPYAVAGTVTLEHAAMAPVAFSGTTGQHNQVSLSF